MAINESIYGAKSTWIDSAFNPYITNKNKVANFGGDSSRLQNGVSNNKLSYDTPIDKTLSYCGLGTESALSHIGYIYKLSGSYAVREWQDSFVTNFAFFQQNSSAVNMSPYPDGCYFESNRIYQTLAWQADRNNDNKNQYLQPYVLINPQNQVLCIYIRACNNSITDLKDVPMSTYISSYKASHPKIINVYLRAFFNNQAWTATNPVRTLSGDIDDSLNSNQKTLSYGRLDNYKCEGKNFDIYSYYLNNCTIMGSSSFSEITKYDDKMLFVMATENCKSHVNVYTTGGDNDYLNAYIEYFEGIEEEIYKTVACFGLYFTPTETVAKTGKLTNNDMYIGLLDENGIGHGLYLRGADTVNAPQNNYTDMSEAGYDYTKEVDKTKYQNDTQFYGGYGTSSFTKFWALTEAQVNELSQELYRIANDVPTGTSITEYNMKVFLTNNPIDCIISLKKFPVRNIPLASTPGTIYLGSKATNITANILATPTWVYYFNFSNSTNTSVYRVFGDCFLDYEPYTKCKIVVPFCGTVEIPVSYIYQYDDLQVALVVDFITGACTGYILVHGITIDSIAGSCAIDLPVSGIQSATLDSQIHSVAMAREKQQTALGTGLIAGAVSIGVGLATGNLPAAIGGGAAIIGSFLAAEDKGKQINYELSHMETPVKQISAASGQIAHTYDMRCKMIITRPKLQEGFNEAAAEVYADTIGYACLLNKTVRELHGFTVGTINLDGIDATAQEKEMIQNAFASGVYLP